MVNPSSSLVPSVHVLHSSLLSITASALHTYTRDILHNTTLTSWLVHKLMERDNHLLENHLPCLDIIVTYQPRTIFFQNSANSWIFVFTIKISRKFPRRFLSSVMLTRSGRQLQEPKLESMRHRMPWRRNVSLAKL